MRIISRTRLTEFCESRKVDFAIAERDLFAWYKIAKNAEWANFGSLKQSFGAADQVGNCVVFDVGCNRFRLVGRVNYGAGIIYVLKVIDHREYDKKLWVGECGCHMPPPKRSTADKASPGARSAKGGRKKRT